MRSQLKKMERVKASPMKIHSVLSPTASRDLPGAFSRNST